MSLLLVVYLSTSLPKEAIFARFGSNQQRLSSLSPMQMSLTEANKQWPFWSMQLFQFSACHCSSCVSSVLAEGAGTPLMRGGSIAMELMSWREVKNASFLCRHWGHFYPAGSRPGLPSPVYKAGCPGWINSNEIILFIMNTVLAQLSSDMLAQHWLPHSQGTKVPHQHLSLLFDVYSWTGCFTLCCSLSGIYTMELSPMHQDEQIELL